MNKLFKTIAATAAGVIALVSCGLEPALGQTPVTSLIPITYTAKYVNVPATTRIRVDTVCKNLQNNGNGSVWVEFGGQDSTAITLPISAPGAGNPGSSCKFSVTSNDKDVRLVLLVGGVSHVNNQNVNSVSYLYGDGYVPVHAATTVSVTASYPTFTLVSQGPLKASISCGSFLYNVDVVSFSRTFGLADGMNNNVLCKITNTGANNVSFTGGAGSFINAIDVVWGDVVRVVQLVPATVATVPPVTVLVTVPPVTVAPSTTVPVPVTTAAPIVIFKDRIRVIVRCYNSKHKLIKCPGKKK